MAATETELPHVNGNGDPGTDQALKVDGKPGKITDYVPHSYISDKNMLHITDSRTGISYDIPVTHNSVRALDFKAIRVPSDEAIANQADGAEDGLRLLDPGFQNTAVKESKITFV